MSAGVLALLTTAAVGASPAPALEEAMQLATHAAESGTTLVSGRDGWMFFAPELRHLAVGPFWGEAAASVSRASKPEQADPLPPLLDFKAQLDRAGIALIVVPVPAKAAIYPETILDPAHVPADGGRIDATDHAFYALLREQGVAVLDLVPPFLERKAGTQLYCQQDTHWSGAACVTVAEILAERLRATAWYESIEKHSYAAETKEVEITGDLWREAGAGAGEKERLPLRFVGTKASGGREPVTPDPASPVVLLGDSHNLVFHAGMDMHAAGAGLADQLALELGFPVDVVAVRGSGATPARINLMRRARAPGYLDGKKVVIWCFSSREFTESAGWMKVPVVK